MIETRNQFSSVIFSCRGARTGIVSALAALMLLLPARCLAGWKFTNLGKGEFGSVAVTPVGITHLVYVKDTMLHVTFSPNGKRLSRETVDGPDAQYALPLVLASDSKGRLHLAYRDSLGSSGLPLMYGLFDGVAWTFQRLDFNVNALDMAIDSHDNPHIVYTVQGLKHVFFDGSAWQSETIPNAAPLFGVAVAIAADDTVHVAYDSRVTSPDEVCHAVKISGSWNTDKCFSNGLLPSLTVDQQNHPHLAYTASQGSGITYAEFDGSNWSQVLLSDNGGAAKVRTDSMNEPKVIGLTGSKRAIAVYFHRFNNVWFARPVLSAPSLFELSLTLDPIGLPHAAAVAAGDGGPSFQGYAFFSGPDVKAKWASIAQAVSKGKTIVNSQLSLSNDGTGPASALRLSFFLSDDDTLDSSDVQLKTMSVSVGTGKLKTVKFQFRPTGAVTGKFLIAQLTPRHPEDYGDKTANLAVGQIP